MTMHEPLGEGEQRIKTNMSVFMIAVFMIHSIIYILYTIG